MTLIEALEECEELVKSERMTLQENLKSPEQKIGIRLVREWEERIQALDEILVNIRFIRLETGLQQYDEEFRDKGYVNLFD